MAKTKKTKTKKRTAEQELREWRKDEEEVLARNRKEGLREMTVTQGEYALVELLRTIESPYATEPKLIILHFKPGHNPPWSLTTAEQAHTYPKKFGWNKPNPALTESLVENYKAKLTRYP
jgi:hypothetical protein